MAIVYSYPKATPTMDDMIIGTRIDGGDGLSDNQTVNFTVTSLLDLLASSTGAQNLQQVTNIGATTTNTITISSDIKVSGKYYDTANQQGTAGQILSSTGVGTQWINTTATGVTSVSATTAGDALDVTVTDPTTTPALAFTWAGNNTQLVDGGGNLQTISTYTLPLAADGTRGGIQIGYVENGKNYPLELSAEKAFVNVPWTDTPYVLPLAADGTRGGVQIGYVENAKNYPVELSSEKMFVNVPWTDTPYVLPVATATDLGGVKIGYTENAKNYPVELASDKMFVNVPWTDTQLTQTITGTGTNNTDSGILLSDSGGTVLILGDGTVITAEQAGNTITLTGTDTGVTGVTLATGTSTGAPLAESIATRELTLTSYAYDGGNNIGYVPTGGTATTYLKGDGSWGAIPTGLIFKDVWDARDAAERGSGSDGGDPDLRLLTPADGWLYIVNVAGSATPNGAATTPNSWDLGDWCIYNGTVWTKVPVTNSGVTSVTTTDGTYIDLTPNTATTGAVTVTAALSAVDGTSDVNTKFLSKDNTWDVPSYTGAGVTAFTNTNGTFISAGTENAAATGAVTVGTLDLSATGTKDATTFLRGDNTWDVPPGTYTLPVATTTVLGGIKLEDDTEQTVAANAVSATASRTYGLQLNSSDQGVINVPWTDTQNPFQTITGTGTDNTDSGVLLSNSGGTVLVLGATGIAASQATNTITLTGTTYALSGIGTDNTDSGIRLAGTGTSAANTDVLILGTGSTTVSQTGNTITIDSAAGSYNWSVKDNQGTPVSKTLANTEVLQFVMATHASAPTAVLTDTGGNSPYIMTLTGKDTTYSLATTSASGLIPTLPNPHGGKFLRGDNTWVVPDYIPDTQNEYATSWVDDLTTNSLIALRLTESGAGSGTQDINIVQGSNMTFTYTDANNITLSATDNNDNTTYAFSVTDPGGTNSNLTITPSTGTAQTIAFTGGTNIDIVPGTNQMTFNATDQYSGTVTSIDAGIGLETASGNAITSTGTILVDYGPGTGNVITFSNGGTSGGTIDKTADYFMWSDTSDAKTVKHNLIQDLPFAPSSAAGTVTSVTGGDGITASASTITPIVSVDYTTTGSANLISSALSSAITVPDDDEILILKSSGSAVGTVERTKVSKLNFTNNAGTLTAVTGTAPVVSSGGTAPDISMAAATGSVNGYLTATDWTTFNNKTSNTGTVTSVGGTGTVSGLTLSGTVTTSGSLTLGGSLTLTSSDITTGGGITGTGTANYVSKWSSATAQTNSLLRDDGVGLSVGDSADANYTLYINDEYGYKSNISVNAGIGFYATCAGVLTGTLFKGEASSGVVMTMLQNGTLEVTGDLIAYGSPSDKKLKENIKPIEKALDKVEKLEGVTFDWKENDKEVRQTWIHDIGFIAQDVQKVIPELVRENEDGLLSMRHQGVTPILVEAIKELKAEIEELKKQIK